MSEQSRPLNVELLQQIKARILDDPSAFNMNVWGHHQSCGSSACIAGWAVTLAGRQLQKGETVFDAAVDVLALDNSDEQGERLFYCGEWPFPFRSDYEDADYEDADDDGAVEQRASVAADRIDFFIATNGTDQLQRAEGANAE